MRWTISPGIREASAWGELQAATMSRISGASWQLLSIAEISEVETRRHGKWKIRVERIPEEDDMSPIDETPPMV